MLSHNRGAKDMYGYSCEYCECTVKERLVKKEVFKHKNGFVMLENVPVGICNKCGYRYYHATILRRVKEIAEGRRAAERAEPIPVAQLR